MLLPLKQAWYMQVLRPAPRATFLKQDPSTIQAPTPSMRKSANWTWVSQVNEVPGCSTVVKQTKKLEI